MCKVPTIIKLDVAKKMNEMLISCIFTQNVIKKFAMSWQRCQSLWQVA